MNLDIAKSFFLSGMSNFLNLNEEIEIAPAIKTKSGRKVLISCDGMTRSITEWAEYVGINKKTLYSRLSRGWSIEDALYVPVKKRALETTREFFSALSH